MAFSANSRLLLPLPVGGATQAGVLRGTVSLQVQEAAGGIGLGLAIEQLGLYGPGVSTDRGDTGIISITGIPAYGSRLVPTAPGRWRVELPLDASVLYRAVERRLGFEKKDDRRVPATETFSGNLLGVLSEQAGSPNGFIFEGSLSLEYQSGGLGWVRHLDLPFVASVVTQVPMPPPGAEKYRLRVQAVGFSTDAGDLSPSGQEVWQQQFQRAAAVWSSFGVQLELVENRLHVERNAALKTDDNADNIRLGYSNPREDVIEFYFTSAYLSDGGGITLSCGSALASVVLTDQQPHPDLLAHEIGHVLNGVHPGATPNPGEWKGEPGSIMGVPVLGVEPTASVRSDTLFRNAVLADLQLANLSSKLTLPRTGERNRQGSMKQKANSSRKSSAKAGRRKG